MKRDDLFKMLGQVSRWPTLNILVVTVVSKSSVLETAQRLGGIAKADEKGAILVTPRGAVLVETLKRGRKWLPLWRGERELTEEELAASEGEIIAAINAMK